MASASAPARAPLFVESQSFWRPWWWLALTVPAIVGAATFFGLRQVAAPPSVKWLPLLSVPLLALLFAVLRLDTHFDADGISYRLAPLAWHRVAWADVQRTYVRQYNPLGEYGGWGIKGFSIKNYAYNAAGNQGLQLELTNGSRLLLGTQQPDAVRQLLLQLRPEAAAG